MIVQIDETMLNHAAKNHRGHSPLNKTHALIIVECSSRARRIYACVISDKKAETLIPIILSQVASNSKIYTDEHHSYSRLDELFAEHCTVCHKYEFINRLAGVNTQTVDLLNNAIKLEIKARKGILTDQRPMYLKEFCFNWNNRDRLWECLLDLLRIN
ncbi:hypothetical protein ENBRE01_2805 [Enteropsectra breve]|nr:hypothetical protein ENBRE01_2805 [Enteropsectra breve]